MQPQWYSSNDTIYKEGSTMTPLSFDETEVCTLYQRIIDAWNKHDATAYAAPFAEDGEVIGFDGSQMVGRAEIAATLQQIFADHLTAPYISKIRAVRFLNAEVAILRAVVGMIPPGQADIVPALNAHHTLIATRQDDTWCIVLFQNTPAQFHGRPDLVQQWTNELRQML
jgi:uncharacterized protein (TIGR02246 family)